MTRCPAGLKDLGGFPKEPSVSLDAFTTVDVIEQVRTDLAGSAATEPWFSVRVVNGPHEGTLGYLPKSALTVFPVVPNVIIHVPGATAASQKYGMSGKQAGDKPYVGVWPGVCSNCAEAAALHVLPETPGSRHMTAMLLGQIANAAALLPKPELSKFFIKPGKKVMIGVLVASNGTMYGSHSNQQDSPAFARLCESIGLRYARPVRTPIYNRRRLLASNGLDVTLQTFDYQCAAPRLIQECIRDGYYPAEMTEVWCVIPNKGQGADPSHGLTIPSCPRCIKTVPYMLCPE